MSLELVNTIATLTTAAVIGWAAGFRTWTLTSTT